MCDSRSITHTGIMLLVNLAYRYKKMAMNAPKASKNVRMAFMTWKLILSKKGELLTEKHYDRLAKERTLLLLAGVLERMKL